ncbi:hypothetical protein IJG04_02705 [Candidatus Saccharibacteria bacterium]|nr:hypothetical protein [Candidatus Saccharibacteria bacterium]
MFFDSIQEIEGIAGRIGCGVFVLPDDAVAKFELKNALILQPESKSIITVEQVREIIERLSVRQVRDQYVIIRPADLMGEEAENAFLKNLEEPQDRVHFVLLTAQPSKMLPTVLSRSAIYFLRGDAGALVDGDVVADAKIKDLAKRLIVARGTDLPALAEEITKKKDGVRAYAMRILAVAIEMLYKSYFKTGKIAFVQKIPKFLSAYEAIEKNGHVKLHLVADLC